MTRRTGAAATRTVDNFTAYRFAVVLLVLAVAGGAVGSVEGLLHAGSWAEPSYLQWTLPVAVDVFLVGTALATLMLRERRAYWSAGLCALVTLALVAFSASVNYAYVLSITDPGTVEHAWGPWIKGSMPVLLLAALEIIAALTSTRNNRANSPLNQAKAREKKLKATVAELRAAARPVKLSRADRKALADRPLVVDVPAHVDPVELKSWAPEPQARPALFEGQVFPPEPIGSRDQ